MARLSKDAKIYGLLNYTSIVTHPKGVHGAAYVIDHVTPLSVAVRMRTAICSGRLKEQAKAKDEVE